MKVIRRENAKVFKNSDVCSAYEYSFDDNDLNAALIVLEGRYPDSGTVVNEISKELVHVFKGTGKLVVDGEEFILNEGDQALINPGEKYYFNGNMTFLVPCSPAWVPEQHKEVLNG